MKKEKEGSLLLGIVALLAVIIIVALVGILALKPEKILVQGEAEAAEYRVSGKVPGRVEMYLFEEGEQVRKGDTLVIIYSPEVEAKKDQALAARRMAEAVNDKAKNGAQPEQIEGAYELYQKALAGEEIYRKSYERVQRLFEKGVVSEQKRDEVEAQYKAASATVKAAKSQYDMALSGARAEDKEAARAQVARVDGMLKELAAAVQCPDFFIVTNKLAALHLIEIFPCKTSLKPDCYASDAYYTITGRGLVIAEQLTGNIEL